MASKKTKLETHPLIAKLGIDPNSPGDLYTLVGYLGPSSRPGHWRIYHSRDFNYFTELAEDAIAHVEPQRPGDENGPSTIYVKGQARVFVTRVTSRTLSSRYLGGRIARAHLATAARAAERGAAGYFEDSCNVTNCPDTCCTEHQTHTCEHCEPED